MRGQVETIPPVSDAEIEINSISSIRNYNETLLIGLTAEKALERLDAEMNEMRKKLFERLEKRERDEAI